MLPDVLSRPMQELPIESQNFFWASKLDDGYRKIFLSYNAACHICFFQIFDVIVLLSIVQMWSQVENGRCWSSQHRQTRQVERSSSHFQRAQVWRPYCFQLWFFVWFSEKLTFVEWFRKGGLSKPERKKFVKCIFSRFSNRFLLNRQILCHCCWWSVTALTIRNVQNIEEKSLGSTAILLSLFLHILETSPRIYKAAFPTHIALCVDSIRR